MPKVKTYVTQSGFFNLAIAAPSMKAAIEAWGISPDAFRRGWAKQTEDPAIVAATMAKPGTVLCRAVGTRDKFTEHPRLPPISQQKKMPAKEDKSLKIKKTKKAKAAEEREERRKQADAERKEKKLKKVANDFKQAKKRHDTIINRLNNARERLEDKLQKEEKRWADESNRFNAKL